MPLELVRNCQKCAHGLTERQAIINIYRTLENQWIKEAQSIIICTHSMNIFAHLSNLLKVIVQSRWSGIVGKRKLPLVEHIAWINLAFTLHLHSCLNCYYIKYENAVPCLVCTQLI